MTPQNKLYEAVIDAAKKVVDRNYPIAQIYVNLDNLREALTAYEQEQPEAIAGEKTKEQILYEMKEAMPWMLSKNVEPYILEAMHIHASQQVTKQTSAKDKEIAELKQRISELEKLR